MLDRRSLLALAGGLVIAPLGVARADATVAAVQEALNRLGYDAGSADGVAGSRTRRTIEAFQADYGLRVDGVASPALLAQLQAAIAAGDGSPERRLARSDQLRSYTRAVQEALLARGYDPGVIDAEIGPQTRDAIRAYQADNGLPVTGEVSRELLADLVGLGG